MYNFKNIRDSRAGSFFIYCKFEGGDADYEEIVEISIPNVDASNWNEEENLKKIEAKLSMLKNVSRFGGHESYEDVLADFGKETASFFDGWIPDDRLYVGMKCTLDTFSLRYYDEKGNLFSACIY